MLEGIAVHKKCLECGKIKSIESFYRKADNSDGRFNICKPCHKARYRPELLDTQKYYVYEHVRPDTGQVFYVGKGCHDRAQDTRGRKNKWWNRIVRKLRNEGTTYDVRIVYDRLIEGDAFEWEVKRIAYWKSRGTPLCNATDGGDGFRGVERTEDHCRKISETLTGRKLSPEHAEKSRRASLGRKQTPEEIEIRRIANTGRKRTEEQKQRMRDSLTPDVLAKREATKRALREHRELPATGAFKKCIRCEEVKDTSHFTRRSCSADGLHVYCRKCKNVIEQAQKARRRILHGADAS